MAERSTAAVDVADNSGDDPLTAKADTAATDGVADKQKTAEKTAEATEKKAVERQSGEQPSLTAPELHSGHKLARRYRLEECVTRLDGFSSWRAVDEKLRRAVGVHLLPADHPRARSVLAAARSSALLGDPRFVQVLDAVEENDLVYVVHEWLPDSTELTALLAAGPLEPHDAYQLVSQVSQAMAAAHREGLAHLRLTPSAVLRSSTGQYRIRGLAVNAALRGITAERPQRSDTEAIGALLYAALTQRWPYDSDAYGLSGLPKGVGLLPPDQVRAGVHRGLSEIAMRALANDGATASRQEPPCTTPDELAKAVAAMPRVKPPEPEFTAPPEYQRTTYQQGTYGRPQPRPAVTQPVVVPPPPLQSRTGRALKWAVSALLIAALGLGSWQIADRLLGQDNVTETPNTAPTVDDEKPEPPKPLTIRSAEEFAPDGLPQNPDAVGDTYDSDSSSYWRTKTFVDGPVLAPYKQGVGIVYDLGSEQNVTSASIALRFGGPQTTVTLYAADSLSPSGTPDSMKKIASVETSDSTAKPETKTAVKTRYVLLWMTSVPYSDRDEYFGSGYKQAITNVSFQGTAP
ncbi:MULTISPECIES: protein kinase family protein [unclassified Streptomyces]|uniref:protein kinase family protein n=1 Tax=unclassified Streptomyces TaxID=2593676 RepID=UPI0006F6F1CE|nr:MULTISPECIES: protein kinase family protein [unclassified Streptomyces]KQX49463.1 serine/threonine protein kinase [Streptomyces sp. Root1304]KRA79082.1 serine/threonine protein kinase [Streptomyces sp. Root66D1]